MWVIQLPRGQKLVLGVQKMLDIIMMWSPPKSLSPSTYIQYIFGIKCYRDGQLGEKNGQKRLVGEGDNNEKEKKGWDI